MIEGYAVFLYEENGVVQASRNKKYNESFSDECPEPKGLGSTDMAAMNNLQLEESIVNNTKNLSLYLITT